MDVPDVLQEGQNQLVTFSMAGEEFSFPINSVQEIVRLPAVTPVPGAPASVTGVMNLRGSILPLVDLRQRFKMESVLPDEDTRVVIIRHQNGTTGMIVDKVNEVLHVENSMISPPPLLESTEKGLQGIARIKESKRVIMILSENELLPEPHHVDLQEVSTHSTPEKESTIRSGAENEEQLVSFIAGDEEFAIPILQVREIVRYSTLTTVPGTPDFFLGLLSLRDSLIPVIDLQRKLNIGNEPSAISTQRPGDEDSRRIIIVDLDETPTGLLVDSVSEVLRVPESQIVPPPETFSEQQTLHLRGIGKINDDQRLLLLLDLSQLLSNEEQLEMKSMTRYQDSSKELHMKRETYVGDEKQVVCFRLAGEEYGIDIMQVREIIRIDTITSVPGAPSYVPGIVNLRGNVLPVIDLRHRLALNADAQSDHNRILVVENKGRTAGLIVDAVNEVLRLPDVAIESPPAVLDTDTVSQYITGIGKLDNGKRTIILIDISSLLVRDHDNNIVTGPDILSRPPTPKPTETTETTEKNPEQEEDLVNQISKAVEQVESSRDTTGSEHTTMQRLMALKKDQLLNKAETMGIKVDKKMTKKEIAQQILATET